MLQISVHLKTTSPQGDGNLVLPRTHCQLDVAISKPHPRKGTETGSLRLRCNTRR